MIASTKTPQFWLLSWFLLCVFGRLSPTRPPLSQIFSNRQRMTEIWQGYDWLMMPCKASTHLPLLPMVSSFPGLCHPESLTCWPSPLGRRAKSIIDWSNEGRSLRKGHVVRVTSLACRSFGVPNLYLVNPSQLIMLLTLALRARILRRILNLRRSKLQHHSTYFYYTPR